jgi:hypothetical protein
VQHGGTGAALWKALGQGHLLKLSELFTESIPTDFLSHCQGFGGESMSTLT